MKYAELPGGKILKFPDEASDKDITRAVRRELGLAHDDLAEALAKTVEALDKHDELPTTRLKEAIEAITDAFGANSSRITQALADAIAQLDKAQGKLAADLTKAMQNQTNLVSKLQASIDSLNKTLDAALGQSLYSVDRSVEISVKVAQNIDVTTKRLEAVALTLNDNIKTMQAVKKLRKRAFRNRDGSWTMEPITH